MSAGTHERKFGATEPPLAIGLRSDGVKQNLTGAEAQIRLRNIQTGETQVLDTEIEDPPADASAYPWRVRHPYEDGEIVPVGEYRMEVHVRFIDDSIGIWPANRDYAILRVTEAYPGSL